MKRLFGMISALALGACAEGNNLAENIEAMCKESVNICISPSQSKSGKVEEIIAPDNDSTKAEIEECITEKNEDIAHLKQCNDKDTVENLLSEQAACLASLSCEDMFDPKLSGDNFPCAKTSIAIEEQLKECD